MNTLLPHFHSRLLPIGRVCIGITVLIANACLSANSTDPNRSESVGRPVSSGINAIQIQILSIGRGVPDETRQVYKDITKLTEQLRTSGIEIQTAEQVLGFEGERQLCIHIDEPAQAEELFDEISALAQDIELMRVSREQCDVAPEQ